MVAGRSSNGRASGAADTIGTNLTLTRGLDILEFLAASGAPMSVEAIKVGTGVPTSSAYRILHSLLERGWVAAAPGGGYVPGLRFIGLAGALRLDGWMAAVASEKMRKVAERTGETVLLTAISGHSALCVARVEGSQLLRATLEPGAVLPLHSGASSLILLAASPKEVLDAVLSRPLARYTEASRVDPDELREWLAETRRKGYAVTTGEVDIGVTAIAVPVRLNEESPVFRAIGPLGLSVVGPAARLRPSLHRGILSHLRSCAQEIADAVSAMP
jgi:DNA-binding IclR family transcriptional regulator